MSKLVYFTGDIALVDNLGIEECMAIQEPLKKLHDYEITEEQELLLRLPCKVGDTLYRIDTDERLENMEIEPYVIDNIVFCKNGDILFKYDAYDGVICHLENIITGKPYLDFYRVFLTEEEAEQKLAEMREERGISMPVLWKEDNDLGIVYFCPHCKIFQCTGNGSCTVCGENIDWSKKQRYDGKVRYERI